MANEKVCGICGFEAKTVQGLIGHKQFKHKILPTPKAKSTKRLVGDKELFQRISTPISLFIAHLAAHHEGMLRSGFVEKNFYCPECGEHNFKYIEVYSEHPKRELVWQGFMSSCCAIELPLFSSCPSCLRNETMSYDALDDEASWGCSYCGWKMPWNIDEELEKKIEQAERADKPAGQADKKVKEELL